MPTGYADPLLFRAATPYGASTVSGQTANPPTADEIEVAKFQGKRVAQVARALKALREAESVAKDAESTLSELLREAGYAE